MANWINNPPFSIPEAVQRGNDIYEVLVTDWGSDVNGSQWPPFNQASVPVSLAAIAIGPRSTVDRAWITFNLQKNTQLVLNEGVITNPPVGRVRQLSLASPLLFAQPAAPGTTDSIFADNFQLRTVAGPGSLYVWDQDTIQAEPVPQILTTNYAGKSYTDIHGVDHVIAQASIVATNSTEGFGWVPPMLHLYLYLKAPLISPSQQRAPLKINYGCGFSSSVIGAESLIGLISTAGRRSVHVTIKGTDPGTYRIGALRVMDTSGVGPTTILEEPVDVSDVIGANTPVTLNECAGNDLYADWLAIYATPAAGGGGLFGFQVVISGQD